MTTNQQRKQFREQCLERDENECIVPWCDSEPDDVHHIIERAEWENGGYIPRNGASVCNKHHQYAEENHIPPQAFWMWLGEDNPVTPEGMNRHVNKWGDEFDSPPHKELRERIKYQSSRHMLPLYWHEPNGVAETRLHNDDTGLQQLDDFVGIPLVITHKIDGGNCMLVNDIENPVRARNGSRPEKGMRPLYRENGLYWRQEVNQKLTDRLQVFGEWVFKKHSIHYGCDCDEPCEDIGPSLSELTGVNDDRAYFQVFGVYDKVLDVWRSWPKTKEVADDLGFPTTPVIYCEDDDDSATYETVHEARTDLIEKAHEVVNNGGEGIVVRTKFPFHYGQFGRRLGKYVRENHVKTDEHWSAGDTLDNNI